MTTYETAIFVTHHLKKSYGEICAVDNISFSIGSSEILGLLGPNGAGKTTTINMILGLILPTSGTIEYFGKELHAHRSEILEKVGFSASYARLPGNLTAWENLYTFALLYGIPKPKERIDKLCSTLQLEALKGQRTGTLSSGEQARLMLAKALIHKPKVLLFDEPTASLDPDNTAIIHSIIKDYVKENNAAVLWTSHDMHEIEKMCGRVLFLSHGKIILEGTPSELPKQHGKKDLEELFISIAREPLSIKS